MKFKKVAKLGDLGYTSMLSGTLNDKFIVYGGSNFPDGPPPLGKRYIHNDMYLLDENFNLISKTKGKIYPDRSIIINLENEIYLISGFNNNKIYRYTLNNNEVIEEEIFDLGFEIIGGFGCFYKEKLYFGKEKIYEFDLKTKKLLEKTEITFKQREQSVYFLNADELYILSGASEIGHLDGYKYNIKENKFSRLNDMPTCLGAANAKIFDEENVIITGGFNKEIYDFAVKNLQDIEYKKKYFTMSKEEFAWNKNIYLYNFKNDEYKIIGSNIEAAKCGHGLVLKNNKIYIINGEYKPGYRDPHIYEGEIK